ncbi:MAG: hypothetical protein IT331_12990 [Anaerolineae bacterium]|nr:hypothetical protein [Anaerolineae bacterium]
MDYGFVSRDDMRGQRYSIRKGQYIAGHAIGIIHLQVWYPLIPGNVVNATTYRYLVRLKELQGGTQDKIHRGTRQSSFLHGKTSSYAMNCLRYASTPARTDG